MAGEFDDDSESFDYKFDNEHEFNDAISFDGGGKKRSTESSNVSGGKERSAESSNLGCGAPIKVPSGVPSQAPMLLFPKE